MLSSLQSGISKADIDDRQKGVRGTQSCSPDVASGPKRPMALNRGIDLVAADRPSVENINVLSRFTRWLRDRRNAKAESEAAWRTAIATGSDGLTGFERDAIAAIEAIAGRLSCERSGRIDRPTLSARIPKCDLVLTLWGEDAQLHSVDGKSIYRRERWDFPTPQESIRDLAKTVASAIEAADV